MGLFHKDLEEVVSNYWKKKAIDMPREESYLKGRLNGVERELQAIGQDFQLESDMKFIKIWLRRIQNYKIQGKKVRARMSWLNEFHRGTK